MVNRKLIRPTLSEVATPAPKYGPAQSRKRVPPDQTHAENFYFVKQMNNRTPMVVRLHNGELLQGVIEWYDRDCIKLNRDGEPNLLVYKTSITYLYKAEEQPEGLPAGTGIRRRPRRKPESDELAGLADGNE